VSWPWLGVFSSALTYTLWSTPSTQCALVKDYSDIIKCYLALLTLGKNDFEYGEAFRNQRFNAMGWDWSELTNRINCAILGLHIDGAPIDLCALTSGYLPLDIDTFVMDHSDSAKEGASYTYAGVYGYCPIGSVPGHTRLLSEARFASWQLPRQRARELMAHRARAQYR